MGRKRCTPEAHDPCVLDGLADRIGRRLKKAAPSGQIHPLIAAVVLDYDSRHPFAERMREVADRSSSVDTVKIAVLTALNIADELFQERETDQDTRQKRLEKQAKRLVTKIEEAMKPGEAGKER